jgi:ABC-type phosphate transport system ATPase subunit
VLDIQHLRVIYGITEALRDVTFEVPQGSIVALLGCRRNMPTFFRTERSSPRDRLRDWWTIPAC